MSKVRDLRKIFSCMKPYRGAFVLAALFVIVESAFEMVIPMIMADVIDVGVAAHDVNYILVQGVKLCAALPDHRPAVCALCGHCGQWVCGRAA